jgi:hypothetical protein
MPVNRLQQALLSAAAPRVTRVDRNGGGRATQRVHMSTPSLRPGRLPLVRAAGEAVPVLESGDGQIVLAPLATQLGCEAELDFGDGEVARVELSEGRVGQWRSP